MNVMTATYKDSPLRRSGIGSFRPPIHNVLVNDDEEERRQARRRTIIENSRDSIRLEENETLKNCLKIYNENKLSKDNAWSLSLIDTLSTLLQSHHKGLNNFKVAGSSLEASSKVYGLRVDSIHTDVLRMSAGLNKQKFTEENLDLDESNIPNEENNAAQNLENNETGRPVKQKRLRKAVSTITKNKDTISGKLETIPLTDPIFGKFNAISGSINSSNRLLQNLLVSKDSVLQLRLENKFWDNRDNILELDNFDEAIYLEYKKENCTKLINTDFENLALRANHTGYIISNIPNKIDEAEKNEVETRFDSQQPELDEQMNLSVAFDMHADSEPIQLDNYAVMDVDLGDMDDLTVDEQVAIQNCKALRRAPVIIEDLRPTDSISNLEYSYRPLDKISRFWAGPSHWKFKKVRNSSIIHGNSQSQFISKPSQKAKSRSIRFRAKQVNFAESHDDLFQKVDESKLKKMNIHKKWDAKKLKLPTDLQIEKHIFDVFRYAPGLAVRENNLSFSNSLHDNIDHTYADENIDSQNIITDTQDENEYDFGNFNNSADRSGEWNHTLVEIGSEFAGAPDKINKIYVPFATRAKVVNMKQLKKSCMQLINTQIVTSKNCDNDIPPVVGDDNYVKGLAKFSDIYSRLPNVLTKNMSDSLSPSVAFYSILHLANEFNLRITPTEDLEDFLIRQLQQRDS